MTGFVSAAVLLACLGALAGGQRRISPAFLLVLSMAPILVGFEMVCARLGPPPHSWAVYATAPAFTVGVLAVGWRGGEARVVPRSGHARVHPAALWGSQQIGLAVSALLVCGLTVTHFSIVGIPALSGNPEIERFNLGASGLFGLPSRGVLFGLPILATLCGVKYARLPGWVTGMVWAVFVLSRLALGFKGGLVEVLVVLFTVVLLRRGRVRPATVIAGLPLLALTMGYGTWIGNQYQTLARSGGASLGYVLDRLTIDAASPAWYSLVLGRTATQGDPAFGHDLRYFAAHYLGLGNGPTFAYDKIVSSYVTGTPLTGDSFLVPVTAGGAAYLINSVGAVLAVVVAGALGYAWQRCCDQIAATRRVPVGLVCITYILAARTFLLNGGGAYLAVNYGCALALLAIPYLVVVTLVRTLEMNDTRRRRRLPLPARSTPRPGSGSGPELCPVGPYQAAARVCPHGPEPRES
ncbi:hypothetical protein ACQEVY_30500 [Streptomyces sp. CA-288835]|uniref:hypothetical protein n=1 Tax=Streptomyces sp. CA-288835 TaxID=3240069 RepID=UPI003D930D82